MFELILLFFVIFALVGIAGGFEKKYKLDEREKHLEKEAEKVADAWNSCFSERSDLKERERLAERAEKELDYLVPSVGISTANLQKMSSYAGSPKLKKIIHKVKLANKKAVEDLHEVAEAFAQGKPILASSAFTQSEPFKDKLILKREAWLLS